MLLGFIEELGVHDIHLNFLNKFHYIADLSNGLTENEIDYVFIGEFLSENIKINQDEISEIRWMPISSVLEDMTNKSDSYTPWFGRVMDCVAKRIANCDA